jgi:ATP-dependent Clp protease protease subunit
MIYNARTRSATEKPTDATDAAPNKREAELLFDARYVMIFGDIDEKMARATVARLLALDQASSDPIKLLISSPGGHVESGDAIFDAIRFVQAPVWTIASGWVASMGTQIFLSAPKERRVCTPNTRFMIHQPSGGAGGTASDIAIQAREIVLTRKRLAQTIAHATGQTLEKVQTDMERDHWMDTDEAKAYGILSRVVQSAKDIG